MIIQNLTNSPKVPFNLDAFILHSEEAIEIVHLLLKKGDKLEEHKNPFDVIFFVIEGKGILSLDGKIMELKQNDTIKVTSDKNRSWSNNDIQDLRILVIKQI